MKLPFLRKKAVPAQPTDTERMRCELHEKLDAAHDKLEQVLGKLRQVSGGMPRPPLRLAKVK